MYTTTHTTPHQTVSLLTQRGGHVISLFLALEVLGWKEGGQGQGLFGLIFFIIFFGFFCFPILSNLLSPFDGRGSAIHYTPTFSTMGKPFFFSCHLDLICCCCCCWCCCSCGLNVFFLFWHNVCCLLLIVVERVLIWGERVMARTHRALCMARRAREIKIIHAVFFLLLFNYYS